MAPLSGIIQKFLYEITDTYSACHISLLLGQPLFDIPLEVQLSSHPRRLYHHHLSKNLYLLCTEYEYNDVRHNHFLYCRTKYENVIACNKYAINKQSVVEF